MTIKAIYIQQKYLNFNPTYNHIWCIWVYACMLWSRACLQPVHLFLSVAVCMSEIYFQIIHLCWACRVFCITSGIWHLSYCMHACMKDVTFWSYAEHTWGSAYVSKWKIFFIHTRCSGRKQVARLWTCFVSQHAGINSNASWGKRRIYMKYYEIRNVFPL